LDSEYEGTIYRTTKNKNTSKYIYGVTVTDNDLTSENGSDLPLNMSIVLVYLSLNWVKKKYVLYIKREKFVYNHS
jgi:hypothetical protein